MRNMNFNAPVTFTRIDFDLIEFKKLKEKGSFIYITSSRIQTTNWDLNLNFTENSVPEYN